MEDTAHNLTNIELRYTPRTWAAKVRGVSSKTLPKGPLKTTRRLATSVGWLRAGTMEVA